MEPNRRASLARACKRTASTSSASTSTKSSDDDRPRRRPISRKNKKVAKKASIAPKEASANVEAPQPESSGAQNRTAVTRTIKYFTVKFLSRDNSSQSNVGITESMRLIANTSNTWERVNAAGFRQFWSGNIQHPQSRPTGEPIVIKTEPEERSTSVQQEDPSPAAATAAVQEEGENE